MADGAGWGGGGWWADGGVRVLRPMDMVSECEMPKIVNLNAYRISRLETGGADLRKESTHFPKSIQNMLWLVEGSRCQLLENNEAVAFAF